MFKNKSILVTGATGSFGKAFIENLIKNHPNFKRLVIFSRDELKQFEMSKQKKFQHQNLRMFIGDIRDKDRILRALEGIDIVIHAAALKQVPTAEYNPFEFIKTNIMGAMNLIDACIDRNVKRVVALSTDKASSPINLYGATKLASDKLFSASNSYSGVHKTQFCNVRYGNVMGSRGSVIPFFITQKEIGVMPITDNRMTRFMIALEDGVKLVWTAFYDMEGGETYVKKIPSMKVTELARAIAPNAKHEIVGIRPGEKLHEQMISKEDALYTYEYKDYYKILPVINNWSTSKSYIKNGKKVAEGFSYTSNDNTKWMSVEMLQKWISRNDDEIGNI